MEKMWFYAVGGREKQGPVTDAELRAKLQDGTLAPTDLVWSDGMANWQAARDTPELASSPAAPAPAFTTQAAPSPAPAPSSGRVPVPEGTATWMSFVAIVHIISGVLSSLSCVGIIYSIFLILSGAALYSARSLLLQVSGIDASLLPFFEKLRSSMKMMGIFYIVLFAISVILFAVFGAAIIAALASASQNL